MGDLNQFDIASDVLSFLKPRVRPCDRVCVALSGGVDSIVLLHLLHALQPHIGYALCACHVQHHISPNTKSWGAFCKDVCKKLNVPITLENVSALNTTGIGIEQAARLARYRLLQRQPVDIVALAHHQDDQAETLLLQLLRGAGLTGLAAMPKQGTAPAGRNAFEYSNRPWFIRPLLNVSKAQLTEIANEFGWEWVEDESNEDPSYRRNWIRLKLLPALREHYPQVSRTLSRTATHVQESLLLIDDLAKIDGNGIMLPDGTLDLLKWRGLAPPRNANLLRYWLKQHGVKIPNEARLNAVLHQFRTMRLTGANCVSFGECRLGWYQGKLHVIPFFERNSETVQLKKDAVTPDTLPCTTHWAPLNATLNFLPADKEGLNVALFSTHTVTIETKRSLNEPFKANKKRPHKTLKNLFQENGIPPWAREGWPIIRIDGVIAAIPCIGVNPEFLAADHAKGVKITVEFNRVI